MAIPKIVGAQRDFSAGELDVSMKRADEQPIMKMGARQMSNWRILNAKNVQQRPGRTIQFLENGRVDEVKVTPTFTVYLAFTLNPQRLRVYSLAGALLFDVGPFPWGSTTLNLIRWDIFKQSIYICFPGMQPQVLTWDGSTWSIVSFSEAVFNSGQKRTFFYRLSPQNVTMLPSGTTGSITLIFSSGIAVVGMVGTRMRYATRQVLITGYNSPTSLNALVIEPLPPSQTLTLSSAKGNFAIGDVVLGSSSGAKGIVTTTSNQQTMQIAVTTNPFSVGQAVTGGTSGATGIIVGIDSFGIVYTIQLSTGTAFVNGELISAPPGSNGNTSNVSGTSTTVQLLPSGNALNFFTTSDTVVGPSGSAGISAVGNAGPQAISDWDDEVMNAFRGWPSSVFIDQFRVGFCNFPAIPGAIGYSAINSPTDFYDDGSPQGAILSIVPYKLQVFDVVPGPESGEFVFCDSKILFIPISTTTPLVSGGIGYNLLSSDGAANVQPRATEELIFYVTAGGLRVKAVVAPGAYFRPFNTIDVSENHTHLFSNIIALAAPTADGVFPERYCYALNSNGSVVIGKYSSKQGQIEGVVGWLPWSGVGTPLWVSATVGSDVIFCMAYFVNGFNVVEKLDAAQYMDCAIAVNNLPSSMTPPAGKGPLWFTRNQSVTLIDQGTRMMGTYQVDANGFIIPQNNAGENLASSQLVAGQPWTAVLEPFVPDANPGADTMRQRMKKRRVSQLAVYVSNSTGCLLARLWSGPLGPNLPALGTIMNNIRFPAWNQDDDPTQPPPLREDVLRSRPLGRAYDPRVALIKDTPGPIMVHEIGMEATT